MKKIIVLMAEELKKRVAEQGIVFDLTKSAQQKIADEGYDPEYGARPLRRSLQKNVEDRLSEELLRGTIEKGSTVVIDVKDGEFIVVTKSGAKA